MISKNNNTSKTAYQLYTGSIIKATIDPVKNVVALGDTVLYSASSIKSPATGTVGCFVDWCTDWLARPYLFTFMQVNGNTDIRRECL